MLDGQKKFVSPSTDINPTEGCGSPTHIITHPLNPKP
jgi:hypothetical protein